MQVVDQYGRPYNLNVHNEQIDIVAKDGTPNILNLGSGSFGDTGLVISGTETVDSEVYTLSVHGVVSSAIDVTFKTIASSDIKTYTLAQLPLMYLGSNYKRDVELIGKTATGEGVILAYNKITMVTSSVSTVATATRNNNTLSVVGVGEGTSVITAWNGAVKLGEIVATVSKVLPVIASVKFKSTVVTSIAVGESIYLKDYVEVLDQYGFPINDAGYWVSSLPAKAIISGTTGIITGVAAGVVSITYLATNGTIVSTTIEVQ